MKVKRKTEIMICDFQNAVDWNNYSGNQMIEFWGKKFIYGRVSVGGFTKVFRSPLYRKVTPKRMTDFKKLLRAQKPPVK